MFGYIRPAYPELKLREYEAYRACYCGLCRALGSRYGLVARMILNYDFVLLVMLLWQPDEPVRFANARCPVKLCRKRPYCRSCAAMEKSAAMSVILAYHKLRDDVRDGGLWKRLGARAASRLLRRAYRKAAGEEPDFDRRVRQSLDALTALETAGRPPWTERRIPLPACCRLPPLTRPRTAGAALWSRPCITWDALSTSWMPGTI